MNKTQKAKIMTADELEAKVKKLAKKLMLELEVYTTSIFRTEITRSGSAIYVTVERTNLDTMTATAFNDCMKILGAKRLIAVGGNGGNAYLLFVFRFSGVEQ